ncbi:MAG TPA: response regulator [Burkholderiales bacterium]
MELGTKMTAQAAGAVNDAEGTASGGRCVLVVDDNQDAAESLGVLLEVMGHEVHIAYDGEQALEMAATLEPDVVLMDINLPKLNGYDAAQQMRALDSMRGATLVALTGWGQGEHRQRSLNAGFDHHLVKPVGLEDLEALLERAGRRPL